MNHSSKQISSPCQEGKKKAQLATKELHNGSGRLLMEWQRSFKRNGIGNQLFLYASLMGLARRNGFQPIIPAYSPVLSVLKPVGAIQIAPADQYDRLISNATDLPQHESHSAFCCTYLTYTEHLYHWSDRDVVLRGAFQSWKYFHPDLADLIKSELVFRDDIRHAADDAWGRLVGSEMTVCLLQFFCYHYSSHIKFELIRNIYI